MFRVFLLSAGGLYPVMLRRRSPRVLGQWPVSAESASLFFCVWLINVILKSHVPAPRCWERKDMDHIQRVDFPTS